MKSIRLFAVIAMMTICGTMFAQTNNYLRASFTNAAIKASAMGMSLKQNLYGVTVGVAQERTLPVNLPLSYEYGADLMYVSGDGTTLLSAIIPVNVTYTFDIDQIRLIPYAGLNFTAHILGKDKNEDMSIDLFNKDEGGCNRFQLGAQFGAKAIYEKYFFGVSYQPSITKLADYTNFNILNISVGILF